MSYWNYRVIKTRCPDIEEDNYQVFEVYYDDHDEIESWTAEPCTTAGESLAELRDDLQHQLEALENPVLVEKKVGDKLTLVEDVSRS